MAAKNVNAEDSRRRKPPMAMLFLGAAGLLIATIGFTYWTGRQALEHSRSLVTHRLAIQRLEQVLSTLKDAETGQRGYLLTGTESYLEPYHRAVADLHTELDDLGHLASRGYLPRERVEEIANLAQQRLAELEQTIRPRRDQGREAALAIVRTNEGRKTMDKVRAQVAEIERGEEANVERAASQLTQATITRTSVFALTAIVNLAFLAWVYRRIAHEMARREAAVEEAERTAAELARSNQDLEQFAYVASHDLQEPLRMITGYLQLLSDRYRGQLDEKADKYIGYAVDGAQRMSGLIRDLLAFSRVNTRGESLGPVSSQEALDVAMKNLERSLETSGGTVTHNSLPVVRGDKTQLVQLFQNLVGNALKFRSPDRSPKIQITAEPDHGQWLFSVQDNGIGFEQQYEGKIFKIFQRLHDRGQYPGTGVGLAICKRIVERHGGRIWATGKLDQGAMFCFTLPAQGRISHES